MMIAEIYSANYGYLYSHRNFAKANHRFLEVKSPSIIIRRSRIVIRKSLLTFFLSGITIEV